MLEEGNTNHDGAVEVPVEEVEKEFYFKVNYHTDVDNELIIEKLSWIADENGWSLGGRADDFCLGCPDATCAQRLANIIALIWPNAEVSFVPYTEALHEG